MTQVTLCLHWTHDVQDVTFGIFGYSPRIFLVENLLSIFFKNNTYSEKNSTNKHMPKVNKRRTRTRCELFSKFPSKKNIRTMSLTFFECLYYYL